MSHSAFSHSCALIDSAGRLLDWDSGLQLEFAAVSGCIIRGGEWRDIVARAHDQEGFGRTGDHSLAGNVRHDYVYRAAGQSVQVTESPLLGGHWYRTALGVSVDGTSIVHDLRNVFMTVLSNVESILLHSTPGSPDTHHIQAIQRAVARGADLIEHLHSPDVMHTLRPGDPVAAPGAAPGATSPRLTILLVDDHDLVRSAVANNLRAFNYRVLAADGADAAMQILRSDEPIDLLFTDVIMPGGMGGAELAAAAQGLRPAIKVLFASGFGAVSLEQSGRISRGAHLLMKPYDLPQLLDMLTRILHP